MRHLKAGKRLGVTTSHRKALMRNLVTALLEHGEIKTTITRAKEMRKYFDRMITFGKKGTLHSKRQALSFIKSRDVVAKLFDEYAPLYAERNGGYTRILRLGNRLGDNAQMALIQMVGLQEEVKATEKESITEIKEELQAEETKVEETKVEEAKVEEAKVEAVEVEAETEAVEVEAETEAVEESVEVATDAEEQKEEPAEEKKEEK